VGVPLIFTMKDKEYIDSVLKNTAFINKMTDEIYEFSIDRDYEDLHDSLSILIDKLTELRNENLQRIRTRIIPPGRQE
jgi:predicted house-cleaning noncanonical NTP pyrophosphatase (MazG superfamily)